LWRSGQGGGSNP